MRPTQASVAVAIDADTTIRPISTLNDNSSQEVNRIAGSRTLRPFLGSSGLGIDAGGSSASSCVGGSTWGASRRRALRASYSSSLRSPAALSRARRSSSSPIGFTERDYGQTGTDTKLHQLNSTKNLEDRIRTIPLGRMADPGEIAETIFFLCSDRASFISGTVLEATGGEK